MQPNFPPFVCPASGEALRFEPFSQSSKAGELGGRFVSTSGKVYALCEDFPDFTYPPELAASDQSSRRDYSDTAASEAATNMIFRTFGAEEEEIRGATIDLLDLRQDSCVLETGAGTGRNSVIIAKRLGPKGSLHYQDLAVNALCKARERLQATGGDFQASGHVGNASYLPFADGVFDAYYHAGGVNTFGDIKRAFQEAARVTRTGGRVVFADETMPDWLRETEFAKVLLNHNPLHSRPVPLQHIPVEARDVSLHWVLNGAYYVLAFTVGQGEPVANFDLPLPGPRGGTLRSRYAAALQRTRR